MPPAPAPPAPRSARAAAPRARAELVAAGWELFSAVLFVSTLVPAAFASPWPALILVGSLLVSARLAPRLLARGARGYTLAAAVRVLAWPLATAPIVPSAGARVIVAAIAFGLMAGGIRQATYRWLFEPSEAELDDDDLRASLRPRLAESAMVAGIVGGHFVLLFVVAFLRTQSHVLLDAWFEIVPELALLGTVGFTFAVRRATDAVLAALAAGPKGDRALLARGLAQAEALPDRLSYLNFALWFACTTIGIFRVRMGPAAWQPGDAVMQVAAGALFAFGVGFYQRAWHKDTVAPAIERLRRWSGIDDSAPLAPLRRRMLQAFGLPLLFTAALSLLSSIGLYRALAARSSVEEDFAAITALITSGSMLVVLVGWVVVRAARELSRPMTQLARAADQVAHGQLDAAVPKVIGPIEVVGLGESVERMREALARTIGELEAERAGLEAKVEARTAELRSALDELKQAQAALVQGERLAALGELVAGVAHEIYNPLNAIAGAAVPLESLTGELREVLDAYRAAERELPPERRRAIEALRDRVDRDASRDDLVGISTVVKRATDRAVRIVTNLRNFSRVSGEPVPTDLRVGIEETLLLLAPRLRQACIQVVKRFDELPPVVCRAGELNQVFMNLIVNAIQALEPDGEGARGGASAGEATITIEARLDAEAGAAIVSVADNGPGVPDAIAPRIFEPFFTTKPRGQGTGLGLSISSDIARRHGGALSLERAEGGGARFVCRIPLTRRTLGSRPSVPDATPPSST